MSIWHSSQTKFFWKLQFPPCILPKWGILVYIHYHSPNIAATKNAPCRRWWDLDPPAHQGTKISHQWEGGNSSSQLPLDMLVPRKVIYFETQTHVKKHSRRIDSTIRPSSSGLLFLWSVDTWWWSCLFHETLQSRVLRGICKEYFNIVEPHKPDPHFCCCLCYSNAEQRKQQCIKW